MLGAHPFHAAGEKYLRALVDTGVGVPLLIPVLDPPLPLDGVLEQLDGLLFTGSPSNIEPHHYSDEPSFAGNLHDRERDATTLPLVQQAIAAGVPTLAVCRGCQEVNVALGGTLWQQVHATGQHLDHREDKDQPLDVQYAPAHALTLTPGGWLAQAAGGLEARVNSLHGQGIRTLAPGLQIEAVAPDGLIEAMRLPPDQGWLLAVQWHPEWKVLQHPFYRGIFELFGAAVAARHRRRS